MRHDARGITLIEMVAVIVVVGLAIPVLMLMWQNLAYQSGRSEAMALDTFYAQELMEEIKMKRFDENTTSDWTDSNDFGPDAGENSNNKDTFDDVDDFLGATDSQVTNPATGYTRSVNVEYIRLNGTTWQGCGSTNCGGSTDCTDCDACCYKRIEVSVSHQFGDASVVTMMSAY